MHWDFLFISKSSIKIAYSATFKKIQICAPRKNTGPFQPLGVCEMLYLFNIDPIKNHQKDARQIVIFN